MSHQTTGQRWFRLGWSATLQERVVGRVRIRFRTPVTRRTIRRKQRENRTPGATPTAGFAH